MEIQNLHQTGAKTPWEKDERLPWNYDPELQALADLTDEEIADMWQQALDGLPTEELLERLA